MMGELSLLIVSVIFTVCAGAAAAITLGFASARSAEMASKLESEGSLKDSYVVRLSSFVSESFVARPLKHRMLRAGLKWNVAKTGVALILASLLTFVVSRPFVGNIAGAILAISCIFSFLFWMRHLIVKRTERFILQLPELSRVLSNGTAAGMSVEKSLVLAAAELPDPAGTEIKTVVNKLSLGWSLDSTLIELSERMPSRELDVLVRTIIIQAKSGGALVSALQDIARALEDRKQLHREVQTVILGSAVSGYIVPLIGVFAVILVNLMKPGVLDEMVSALIGKIILFTAFTFFALGAFLVKIVSRIEV